MADKLVAAFNDKRNLTGIKKALIFTEDNSCSSLNGCCKDGAFVNMAGSGPCSKKNKQKRIPLMMSHLKQWKRKKGFSKTSEPMMAQALAHFNDSDKELENGTPSNKRKRKNKTIRKTSTESK